MASWNSTAASSRSPASTAPPADRFARLARLPLLARLARLARLGAALLAHVRGSTGSTWAPVALRALAMAFALVVLAWIGRTAAARSSAPALVASLDQDASVVSPSASTSASSVDRDLWGDGGAPLAFASLVPPAPAPAGEPPPSPSRGRTRASPTDPVFINHASVDDLRRLPGVGPKRAEAILIVRQRIGKFQRVEDLLRVKGIGRATVKRWRPLVRLDVPDPESAFDGGLR